MKKPLYAIIFLALMFAQSICGQSQTNSPSAAKTPGGGKATKTDYPNLKAQAEETGKATLGGDFEKVVDFTYPKIVEMAGGKEKMIAFLKSEFAQMKTEGFEITSMTIDEVKQVENIESELFAVVLTTMTMKTPNGKTEGKSSLIGISGDNGTNWKFVNANNQESFNAMFPKAAEKIKIPAEQPPKPIKD